MHSMRCCLLFLVCYGQGTERDSKKVTGSLKSNEIPCNCCRYRIARHPEHPQTIVYQKTQSLLISFVNALRQTAPRWSPCRDAHSRFARQLIVNEGGHMSQLISTRENISAQGILQIQLVFPFLASSIESIFGTFDRVCQNVSFFVTVSLWEEKNQL